jgi:hypothetical protein
MNVARVSSSFNGWKPTEPVHFIEVSRLRTLPLASDFLRIDKLGNTAEPFSGE